ncbi:unnamed protein product [Darwinula stevensoni]|uniref:RBR-type E3 ubiquitin transferase n=1 Tax=Darwinula stevensoni TaxID=69355 RepID=A0A7R8X2V9_9CRUS|nr:unnamed protein product [Darwinula stevensoni]CAG0884323.1 unnamed protein product [Darwinula stevensoni]
MELLLHILGEEVDCMTCDIKYLPPVRLDFRLPLKYPSTEPPLYTISCIWLTRKQLSRVCEKFDMTWSSQKGEVVLFQWINFLQSDLLHVLGIEEKLDLSSLVQGLRHSKKDELLSLDSRAVQEIPPGSSLLDHLLAYDEKRRLLAFEESVQMCNVCFVYFSVLIKEGSVNRLQCPEEKCTSYALPSQVKDLVSADLFVRYDRLLLSTSLDLMKDVTYCPRTFCLTPVLLDDESTIGLCPSCSFAFCKHCKRAYHGVMPCALTEEEKGVIYNEFIRGNDGVKEHYLKKYGRRQISEVINQFEFKKYCSENTKPCPNCKANIEKNGGCNKMSCFKCGNFFCWLCLELLDPCNPYLHYSTSNKCLNKLFEGVDDEMEDFVYEFL